MNMKYCIIKKKQLETVLKLCKTYVNHVKPKTISNKTSMKLLK